MLSNPFFTVALHELRLLWRNKTIAVLFALVAAWTGLAVYSGSLQQRQQVTTTQRLQASDRAATQKIVDKLKEKPDFYYAFPRYAFQSMQQHATLPPGPLAALDIGQSDVRTSVYPLNSMWDRQPDWAKAFLTSGPLHNETVLQVGRFDMGFFMVYLLPLIVIALSFGILAGEREKGTLLLVLSQPVSVTTLLWASLLVRYLVVLMTIIVSTTIFLTVFAGPISIEAWLRVAIWFTIISLYMAFWFGVCAVVVAPGGKSAANALTLVVLWVLIAFAVPGTISLAGEALHPVPARSDISQAINIARDETNENWRSNETPFRIFYQDFPELLPDGARITPEKIHDPLTDNSTFQFRFLAVKNYALEKIGLKASQPHRTAFQNQMAFIRQARLLSPVIATRNGLMDIAGAGDERYLEFDRQVTAFWKKSHYYWMHRLFREKTMTINDYRSVPEFRFHEERARRIATRLAAGMAAMLGLTLILAFSAGWLARRNQSPLVQS